jgi:putative sigma-54 modulation protein
MKINIHGKGKHLQITEAIKDHVEKKVSRLERYFEQPLAGNVNVTLSVVREEQTVEITIPLKGLLLRAEERSSDMYASIDEVIDKLERQIRKHKTKINKKHRENADMRDLLAVETGTPFEEEEDFEIVRTKNFDLKPMDVEEAILQMNLVGHNFYMFKNSSDERVNVVYRRDGGQYGLLEPNN